MTLTFDHRLIFSGNSFVQFIRTRHNNLRCFPSCSPVHKQNAFCGSPIYVKVKRLEEIESPIPTENIFAGFHLERQDESCKLDEPFDQETVSKSLGSIVLQARMYKQDQNFSYFIFMPDGKWTYAATLVATDKHHFSVFYVVNGRLIAKHKSPFFHVIPTWKVQSSNQRSRSAGTTETAEVDGTVPETEEENLPIGSPADGISPDLPYQRVATTGYFERFSPSESKRPRLQMIGMQAPGNLQGDQGGSQTQGKSMNPNMINARFGRPPLLQTSLPYAMPFGRSLATPLGGGQPASTMAPPHHSLYSPSFAHPGSSPTFIHGTLGPAPVQGYGSQEASFMNQFPTPLSSPFGQVSMTISPPGVYPSFSYFPTASSSPRMPAGVLPPQPQTGQQQQEFAGTFSPLGQMTFQMPPTKKQ